MLRSRIRTSHILTLSALLALPVAHSFAAEASGEVIYQQRCAACHEKPTDRAPTRQALAQMPPLVIAQAMMGGAMQQQAAGLGQDEILTVATYLGAKGGGAEVVSIPSPPACKSPAPALKLAAGQWNGWSPDLDSSRFQPTPGVAAADVPKLKLKWAYGYTGRMAYGQPIFVGDRIFVTNTNGEISSLDAKSGCAFWTIKVEGGTGVRSTITIAALPKGAKAKYAALFGDDRAVAHAIDAETGAALWSTKLDDHPFARVTGGTRYYDGKVFVPVSSVEEVPGRDAKYECCKFRGAVAALDVSTGKLLWKSYAIQAEPKPFKKNSAGTQMFGPAGAAIWSTPTIDTKRKLVYASTGNSYTDVDTDGNDGIVAFDIATGERKWMSQVTPHDNYLVGCGKNNAGQANCPEEIGPDHDFGTSPILRTLPGGKQILIAGQKSGVAFGLDPDQNGKIVWEQRVGTGSALGGIEWGHAADNEYAYVAISDIAAMANPQPGLTALKLATGEKVWNTPTPPADCPKGTRCSRAQPGAVTVIPGVVFSGALDGHIRAYDSRTGAIIWDFATTQEFPTVNGVNAKGGSIDAGGTVVSNGMVLVNSGYGTWGITGHLMMVFTVEGK
jgi:polyvinyl alcohol dehydrogenase (cytochrome)